MNTANTTTTRRRIDSLTASQASAQTRRGEMRIRSSTALAQHLGRDPGRRHRPVPQCRDQPGDHGRHHGDADTTSNKSTAIAAKHDTEQRSGSKPWSSDRGRDRCRLTMATNSLRHSSHAAAGMGFALADDLQEQLFQRGGGIVHRQQLPVVPLDHLPDFLLGHRRSARRRGSRSRRGPSAGCRRGPTPSARPGTEWRSGRRRPARRPAGGCT